VTVLGLLAVVGLIAISGYFVAAEFAYVTARRSELEREAESGDRKAGKAVKVLGRLSFMLSGAQLGITVTSLIVGFIAEPVFVSALGPLLDAIGVAESVRSAVAVTTGFILATGASMVFGELAPKNLAIARPHPVAKALAGSTLVFMRLASPIIRFFDDAANRLLRAVGIEPVEELQGAVSADELDFIAGESAAHGALTEQQADLFRRAISFRDLTAADAMVPRNRVARISSDSTAADVQELLATGHSRFPVVTPGDSGDYLGVVQAKDLLRVAVEDRATTTVEQLMVPAVALPEAAPLPVVLTELRDAGRHMALVIDEHGDTSGIITLEDLVEELVGDIADEHDAEAAERHIHADGAGGWLVPGARRPDEIRRATGIDLPDGDYDTVAGLVVAHLSRLAEVGDEIEVDEARIQVTEKEGHGIAQVRITPSAAPTDEVDRSGER